jgi:hypothetical protein
MNIKLIHKEWEDNANLDIIKNRLNRVNIKNECAYYKIIKNLIFIKWDKWDEEIFITHYNNNNNNNNDNNDNKDNNIYYLCNLINFHHTEWEDKCYLDYFNNIIYRESNYQKGIFTMENDDIIIEWGDINLIPNNIDIINKKQDFIPNIIHFIFGLKEQIEEFELYRYIAIKSAYEVNKPDKIFFYYYYEPYGYW